jgi:uncharacterized protein YggU (UPF0235/DUF167 family)
MSQILELRRKDVIVSRGHASRSKVLTCYGLTLDDAHRRLKKAFP